MCGRGRLGRGRGSVRALGGSGKSDRSRRASDDEEVKESWVESVRGEECVCHGEICDSGEDIAGISGVSLNPGEAMPGVESGEVARGRGLGDTGRSRCVADGGGEAGRDTGVGDAGLGDAGLGDAGLGDAGLGDASLGGADLGDVGREMAGLGNGEAKG
jgi:hypothetical protein